MSARVASPWLLIAMRAWGSTGFATASLFALASCVLRECRRFPHAGLWLLRAISANLFTSASRRASFCWLAA